MKTVGIIGINGMVGQNMLRELKNDDIAKKLVTDKLGLMEKSDYKDSIHGQPCQRKIGTPHKGPRKIHCGYVVRVPYDTGSTACYSGN